MPLRYLFVDMNSYFASVEQQARPELRGKPVGVVPVFAETTCCIAASYEAKRFGVKTGTMVREARRLCPGIRIVPARPELYIDVHHRIIAAVDSCLPVTAVMSIDEMICRLSSREQQPDAAVPLARQVKEALRRDVGEHVLCSIGLAPNRLLAKVAGDMQKPDGLTVILSEDLPEKLYELSLTDLPGIGPRMKRRLDAAGVADMRQFWQLDIPRMSQIWGSKLLGAIWWRQLRGEDLPLAPTRRKSLGHSHVLPPEMRRDDRARAILIRLVHKVAARLRQTGYGTGLISLQIEFGGGSYWHAQQGMNHCQDTLTLIRAANSLWGRKPTGQPFKVGIVLGDLIPERNMTRSLFDSDRRLSALAQTMDRLNHRFGPQAVYFAGMHGMEDQAPTRIAFTHIPEKAWQPNATLSKRLLNGRTV